MNLEGVEIDRICADDWAGKDAIRGLQDGSFLEERVAEFLTSGGTIRQCSWGETATPGGCLPQVSPYAMRVSQEHRLASYTIRVRRVIERVDAALAENPFVSYQRLLDLTGYQPKSATRFLQRHYATLPVVVADGPAWSKP